MPERYDIAIVSTGHDISDARLHRQVTALTKAGLSVAVLALGDASAGPASAHCVTKPHRGRIIRFWRAFSFPWQVSAAVVVTFDPELALGAVIRRAVGRTKPKLVCDVHEDYHALLKDRPWARGPRLWAAKALLGAVHWAYRRADLVMVADSHLLEQFPQRYVLRNLPLSEHLPVPTARGAELTALYIGDLRGSRGLYEMLEAVAQAPKWHLQLIGPMSGTDRAAVRARLEADPELAQRVFLSGRLTPDLAWAQAGQAALGLLLLENTPAFASAMPTKLYEYLSCGIPVLSSPLPRPKELLEETGSGLISPPGAAGTLLNRLAQDPQELNSLRRAAREVASRYRGDEVYRSYAARLEQLRDGQGLGNSAQ